MQALGGSSLWKSAVWQTSLLSCRGVGAQYVRTRAVPMHPRDCGRQQRHPMQCDPLCGLKPKREEADTTRGSGMKEKERVQNPHMSSQERAMDAALLQPNSTQALSVRPLRCTPRQELQGGPTDAGARVHPAAHHAVFLRHHLRTRMITVLHRRPVFDNMGG